MSALEYDTGRVLVLALGASVAYYLGFRHADSLKIAKRNKRSFDDGWNQRGIADWQKSQAKRDAKGRFSSKPKL